jgi:hypothetical protein
VDRRLLQSFSFSGSFLCWHLRSCAHLEGLPTFVDGQQISHEFAGHRERGAVAVSAFQFAGMQRGQLRTPSRGQLGGLDQRGLQPAIALFGDGSALLFARRRFQRGGEPTIAHGIGAGAKALRIADFQGPGQSGNFSHGGDAHEPLDALRQLGVDEQLADQPLLRALEHFQRTAAQAQQIDYRLRHFFEFFQQAGKIFLAVQLLFHIEGTGFHQQSGHFVLHAHRFAHQQAAIAHQAAQFANARGGT